MFRLVVVLACVAAAIAATSPLDEKVIGGSPASPGQFPYQISMRLRQNGQHHCGGTIINSRFIITAAHCVYRHLINDFIVVVGTNKLSSGGMSYTLENAVYHGEYDPQNMSNDIAILKTSQDIVFSSTVQALPLQQSEVPSGSVVILSGWGLTSWPGNAPPDTLQYITLRSIDIQQCANTLQPGSIFNSQICTYTATGQGACAGDSGGPLVYEGHLAGVVSWGRPCAAGYPDVFTKVSSYVHWIQVNIQSM